MTTPTTRDDDVAAEANEVITTARQGCVERGEGLNRCHVYLEGAVKCCCGDGPDLSERRMK